MRIVLEEGAYMPVRAHEDDAGLDLMSRDDDFWLWPGHSHIFDTGVHVELPKGTSGHIKNKSGLNVKHGIVCAGDGVIDENYRGSICVKLYNLDKESYKFCKGDKVAQLVIVPCLKPELEVVEKLDETDRNEDGFGSTGR